MWADGTSVVPGAGRAGQADRPVPPTARSHLGHVGLLVALLVGAVVIWLVDRWRKKATVDAPDSAEELTDFRGMYERGEITEEEYVKLRDRVADGEASRRRDRRRRPPEPAAQTSAGPPRRRRSRRPAESAAARRDFPIRPRVQNPQGRAVGAVGLRLFSGTSIARL